MFIHAHHVMHMHSAQHCKQWRLLNDSSHRGTLQSKLIISLLIYHSKQTS